MYQQGKNASGYVEYVDRARRGWPVVATGTPESLATADYRSWRNLLDLPDESTDFCDRDVFDVAFFLIDRARGHVSETTDA